VTLHTAIRLARSVAPASHMNAARLLMLAGLSFNEACRYSLHCARAARTQR